MFEIVTLLATSVIENIEHKCRYYAEGCQERLVVDMLEEACQFRPVLCPSLSCNKTMAFAHLVDHLLEECNYAQLTGFGMYEVIEDDMFTEAYIHPSNHTAVYVDTLNW